MPELAKCTEEGKFYNEPIYAPVARKEYQEGNIHDKYSFICPDKQCNAPMLGVNFDNPDKKSIVYFRIAKNDIFHSTECDYCTEEEILEAVDFEANKIQNRVGMNEITTICRLRRNVDNRIDNNDNNNQNMPDHQVRQYVDHNGVNQNINNQHRCSVLLSLIKTYNNTNPLERNDIFFSFEDEDLNLNTLFFNIDEDGINDNFINLYRIYKIRVNMKIADFNKDIIHFEGINNCRDINIYTNKDIVFKSYQIKQDLNLDNYINTGQDFILYYRAKYCGDHKFEPFNFENKSKKNVYKDIHLTLYE